MKKFILPILVLALALPVSGQETWSEPNVEVAKGWWPDLVSTWTPVGWPDHYFKYSVFYNGAIVLDPAARFAPTKWPGEDFQLTFRSGSDGSPWAVPGSAVPMRRSEDQGLGIQEWVPGHEAPVLRTIYRHKDGYVFYSDMFAHIPGGNDVKTSVEPEFAWVRISVPHVDEFYHPDRLKMSVLLTKRFIFNQVYYPEKITDLPKMTLERTGKGYRVVTSDGKVRVSFPDVPEGRVTLQELSPSKYNLCIDFPCEKGAYVDMLVPALAYDPADVSVEEGFTYEKALAAADAYWTSLRPSTQATFHTPEPFLNEALEASLKFLPVLGEKNYKNGEYCYLSSTLVYEGLWSTPGSMIFDMFLDHMGWFPMTEHYSEVFKDRQGTAVAPGPSFKMHPGYFSSPRYIAAIDWLSDHGALMQQMATHALLSGDQAFIDKWTEPLVKACDFIKDMSLMEHPGVPGLLPPGYSSDEAYALQSTANLAWNYKGLTTTIRLLKRLGHPRAAEFEEFAKGFKARFQEAYRKICDEGQKWTDKNGRLRYQPPTSLASEGVPNLPEWMLVKYKGVPEGYTFMSDAFYLDGGPLILVWAGLMDADDPIMEDLMDFFREGPNWELFNAMSPFEPCDRAILIHEMSSCEPCYSWNVFHNWQKGDRKHYLEGMYSLLVGSISQKTYISCEHRHHVQGTLFSYPLAFYMAKLAVIDDQISEGNLHLLRFCPIAWCSSKDESRFLSMPTEYGPVDLRFRLSDDGKTLEVSFNGNWREAPGETILHVPPVPGLKSVRVNGKKYSASKGEIRL